MAPTVRKQTIGKLGEDKAASFLEANGFTTLDRNFRTRWGEIDILATKSNILYCVEVKTRSTTQFGYPSEAITPKKLQKMQLMAQIYANNCNFRGQVKLILIEILHGTCTLTELE